MHNYFTKQALIYRKSSDPIFEDWVKDLPKPPPNWPGGIGPNYLDSLRKVITITQPKSILEIGFNLGGSALAWLHLSDATLVSVDINPHDVLKQAGDVLTKQFPGRFKLIICQNSERKKRILETGKSFDLIFIDGDHTFGGVMSDIGLARSLGIKRMVFDDWLLHWGPGVSPAIEKTGLKLEFITNNLAYCEETGQEWRERISLD